MATGQQRGSDTVSGVLRVFGQQLKLLRERTGMSRAEFGEAVGYSPSTIASFEQGRRIAPAEFVKQADELVGAGGVLVAAVEELGRQRLPSFFQGYAEYEQVAVSHYWYGSTVVPGLLQTEDYARALLNANCPPLEEQVIDERLAARMERQSLLTRRPPVVLGFVIGEAVLRTPVGGPTVFKRQLNRVLECGEQRNVEIQIMPFSRGAHVGLNGPMVLLETPERLSLAYVESQDISVIITDRQQVSEFAQRYGILRAQALNTEESARLIEQVAGGL
jgi:transcriptional regulator with XRE-family HTH domain